jgi:hypothetical protein
MRVLLTAMILMAALWFTAAQAEINAPQNRPCADPPGTSAGRCFKKAGARCDLATHRWIGGNDDVYTACVSKQPREQIVRPNTSGQVVTLPRARNLKECVASGVALGHPRVGPGGEYDRQGALGFCHSLGF